MRQERLFEDALPARYQRIYADMERQGIIVPPTPPDYCDLCGREDDCFLVLDAPGRRLTRRPGPAVEKSLDLPDCTTDNKTRHEKTRGSHHDQFS